MKTDTNENFGWRLLSRNNFKEISCISVSVHKKDLFIKHNTFFKNWGVTMAQICKLRALC